MNENIITIYDAKNNKKDYKILLIIEKKYCYIICSDINNPSIKNNLIVVKLVSLDNLEILPISDDEWKSLEDEYTDIIKSNFFNKK